MIQLTTNSMGRNAQLAALHDTAPRAMAGATPIRKCLSGRVMRDGFIKKNNRSNSVFTANAAIRPICSASGSVQVRSYGTG